MKKSISPDEKELLEQAKKEIECDPVYHEYLASHNAAPTFDDENLDAEGWYRKHDETYTDPTIDNTEVSPQHKEFIEVLEMYKNATEEQKDALANTFIRLESKWTKE